MEDVSVKQEPPDMPDQKPMGLHVPMEQHRELNQSSEYMFVKEELVDANEATEPSSGDAVKIEPMEQYHVLGQPMMNGGAEQQPTEPVMPSDGMPGNRVKVMEEAGPKFNNHGNGPTIMPDNGAQATEVVRPESDHPGNEISFGVYERRAASIMLRSIGVGTADEQSRKRKFSGRSRERKGGKRLQKPCPICHDPKVNIYRHMQTCHAQALPLPYKIRKATLRYKSVQSCPIQGCTSKTKRLDRHYIGHHGYKARSQALVKLLERTRTAIGEVTEDEGTEHISAIALSNPTISKRKEATRKPEHATAKTKEGRPVRRSHRQRFDMGSSAIRNHDHNWESETDDEAGDGPVDVIHEKDFDNYSFEGDNSSGESSADSGDEAFRKSCSPKFQVPDPPSKALQILNYFYKALGGVDGGEMTKKNATQHKEQVTVIWGTVSNKFRLSALFDSTQVKEKFLNQFSKNQRPGTAKSYLTSLRKFVTYIDAEDIAPNYSSTSILASISMWMSIASKKQGKRCRELQTRAQTPDLESEAIDFEASKAANDAVVYLKRIGQGYVLPIPEVVYNNMQHYLIGQLLVASDQMVGAVRHLKVEEFKKRNHFTKDDGTRYAVMAVQHHNTLCKGEVTIAINTEVEYLMSLFLEQVRKPLQMSRKNRPLTYTDYFFVGYDGHRISSHTFLKLLTRFNIGLNATLLQKMMTTRVLDPDRIHGTNLAKQMVHSESTQSSSVDLRNIPECCVLVTPLLLSSIQGEPVGRGSTDVNSEVKSSPEHCVGRPQSVISADEVLLLDGTHLAENHNAEAHAKEEHEAVDRTDVEIPTEGGILVSRARNWPPRPNAIAHKLFRRFIETDRFPLVEDVRQVLSQTGQGAELEQVYGHQKVRDKIRAIIRTNRMRAGKGKK